MDYEGLKDEIKQISEISNSVPDQFKDKCFEVLLSELLQQSRTNANGKQHEQRGQQPPQQEPRHSAERGGGKIPISTQLRVLMRRTGLTDDDFEKVVFVEGGEVHFIKEPHNVAVATGQIEWSLLLALKNAIVNDALTVDPEAVRSICQEKGFYDKKNFASVFKQPKNANLFKDTLAPQGAAQPLTLEGQDALAKVVKRLAGEGQ